MPMTIQYDWNSECRLSAEFLHATRLISIEFSLPFPGGYGTNSGDAINSGQSRVILLYRTAVLV